MVKNNMKVLSENNRGVVLYAPPIKIGGKYWFSYANRIYSYDEFDMKVTREHIFTAPSVRIYPYGYPYCFTANVGNKIILAPHCARDVAVYDIGTKNMSFFELESRNTSSYYRNIAAYGDKVFLLPALQGSDILVLDNLRCIRRIKLANWNGNIKKSESTSEYVIQGRYLWVTAHYSSQVLKLDMETEKYELIAIGKDSIGYTGIALDGECLWLAESNTGAFVRYDTCNGNTLKFTAPAELDYNSVEKSYVHMGLFDFETYIISTPALCNKMTILNKETGKLEILKIDFFDSIIGSKAKYKFGNYQTSCFGMKVDDKTLWVQRTLDGVIACINMKDFTYSMFTLELSEEDIDDICTEIYRLESEAVSESGPISLSSFIHFLKETDEDTNRQSKSHHGVDIWAAVNRTTH